MCGLGVGPAGRRQAESRDRDSGHAPSPPRRPQLFNDAIRLAVSYKQNSRDFMDEVLQELEVGQAAVARVGMAALQGCGQPSVVALAGLRLAAPAESQLQLGQRGAGPHGSLVHRTLTWSRRRRTCPAQSRMAAPRPIVPLSQRQARRVRGLQSPLRLWPFSAELRASRPPPTLPPASPPALCASPTWVARGTRTQLSPPLSPHGNRLGPSKHPDTGGRSARNPEARRDSASILWVGQRGSRGPAGVSLR